MKALRTKICTYAIALLVSCGFATSSMAGSSDFSGIFGAFNASAGGAQISGTHTNESSEVNEGTVGGVYPLAGYEIGFNLPLGDIFFLGVGHSWTKGGSAHIADSKGDTKGSGDGDGNAANSSAFHLTASDLREVYVMPSISIYDNAAVYVKLGRSVADLEASGSVTGNPGNLTGDVIGIGTIAMTPSGLFVKTEGTVTRFNDIRIVGVGGSSSIAVGFKF